MLSRSLQLLVIASAFALPLSTSAFADDPRVDYLRIRQMESDIARLQRDLDTQSRRLDELEQVMRTGNIQRGPSLTRTRADSTSPGWLVSSNWDRVRPGMSDLDVIAVLGRPNTVRTDADGKTHSLLYALELGPTAVLAGNVKVGDSGVTEINKPTVQ